MKEQILRLCRRLNQFTLDEITTITEMEQEEIKLILDELIQEKHLININMGYKYLKPQKESLKYQTFIYYGAETIDMIIKFFCTEIPAYKTSQILGIGNRQAIEIYDNFRKLLYERQYNQLISLYDKRPQEKRSGVFFDKEIYFYTYNSKVYVSDIIFKGEELPIIRNKQKQEFKKIYCYLRRSIQAHNKNQKYLTHKIAELIWRKNKSYDDLYGDLTEILNISYKRLTNFFKTT